MSSVVQAIVQRKKEIIATIYYVVYNVSVNHTWWNISGLNITFRLYSNREN